MQHQAGGAASGLIFEAGRRARYAYHGACPAPGNGDGDPAGRALAMAAAYEEPVYGYAFAGGSAAGTPAGKDGIQGVHIYERRFTGAALSGAWFQNAVFENCDLSGAKRWRLRSRRCACGGVSSRG